MENLLAPIQTGLARLIGPLTPGIDASGGGRAGLATTDSPDKDIRLGLMVVVGFFGVFLGWAALCRVDAAVYAKGQVVVSGNRQQVQNKTGGVVRKLLVQEGQQVKKGQVLIELAGDESQASTKSYTAQFISLKTQEARLLAEQAGRSAFAEPAEFKAYTGDQRQLANDAMQVQRQAMSARRSALNAQLSVLVQQAAQSRESIRGTQERIDANVTQQRLTGEELAGVKSLNEKGYAPGTRVRSLESDLAGLVGDNGNLHATIAQANATIGESQMRGITLRRQNEQDIVTDLRDTQSKLSDIMPQLDAAKTEFDRTDIRAPVDGKVMGLTAFTEGGVITPGEKIMDIVPNNEPLVIDAMVTPQDGDDVHVGQTAQVRFTSMHERDIPQLTGKVLDMSGDSFQDQKTGTQYFKARVEVSADSLAQLAKVRGSDTTAIMRPGLPAEVVVPLKKRTVLGYLLEPLGETFWRSFHEH